jgi:hypothetical protein
MPDHHPGFRAEAKMKSLTSAQFHFVLLLNMGKAGKAFQNILRVHLPEALTLDYSTRVILAKPSSNWVEIVLTMRIIRRGEY